MIHRISGALMVTRWLDDQLISDRDDEREDRREAFLHTLQVWEVST